MEFFGDMGGIIELLMMIGSTIMGSFTSNSLIFSLISGFYKVQYQVDGENDGEPEIIKFRTKDQLGLMCLFGRKRIKKIFS